MPYSRLADVMIREGVSQQELSRRARVARQTVVDAYHGRSSPTVATWVAFARALNVPLADLDPDAAVALAALSDGRAS